MDYGELERRLRAVLTRREEVLEAYVFGSQARRRAGPLSDIDVAVYVERDAPVTDAPWGYRPQLISELCAALGRSDVDVVVLNEAPPLLYHRVLRDGLRLLARDLAATTTREAQALSRYFDFLPAQREMDELFRQRVRAGEFGR